MADKTSETLFKFTKGIATLDLETTGLDITKDRIVQIAVVRIDLDGTRTEKDVLVNPTIPIPKEATDVHGITDEMVKDKPKFKQIASSLLAYIDGYDIMGFNVVRFDIPLLIEELNRANVEFDYTKVRFIDAMGIYKHLHKRDLATFYNYYTGKTIQNAHNAMADTKATVDGFMAMLEQEPELKELGVEELQSLSGIDTKRVDFAGKFIRNEAGVVCFNFSEHKGKPATSELGMLSWMLNKDFPSDTLKWAQRIKEGTVI